MFFRFALQMIACSAPLATILLSLLLAGTARSQPSKSLVPPALSASAETAAVPRRFLVVYRNGQVPANAQQASITLGARLTQRHDLLGIVVLDNLSDASRAALAADPSVEAIIPDLILNAHALSIQPMTAHASPAATAPAADSLYHSPQGWAVRQVGGFGTDGNATSVAGPWNITKGRGVRIAILDTGVDPGHPDIAPNLVLNLSDVNHKTLPTPCDDGSPVDQQGHGTWTASLAAGALGATSGLIAGVAPSASILNIKVLQRMPAAKTPADPTGCINGQGSGLLSWVLQGIEDAITHRADIISMSLGAKVDVTTGDGAGTQVVFNRATEAAYNAGIVLIAAAGNDAFNLTNQRFVELPAQSRNVLAIVASTNPACAENLKADATCVAGPVTMPYYSNYGTPLQALAAPGGSYPVNASLTSTSIASAASGWITGACASGNPSTLSGVPADTAHSFGCFNLGHAAYVQAMGTSASAPLAAGAAALILAEHPTWKPAAVIQALRTSATPATPSLSTPQVNVTKLLTPPAK